MGKGLRERTLTSNFKSLFCRNFWGVGGRDVSLFLFFFFEWKVSLLPTVVCINYKIFGVRTTDLWCTGSTLIPEAQKGFVLCCFKPPSYNYKRQKGKKNNQEHWMASVQGNNQKDWDFSVFFRSKKMTRGIWWERDLQRSRWLAE